MVGLGLGEVDICGLGGSLIADLQGFAVGVRKESALDGGSRCCIQRRLALVSSANFYTQDETPCLHRAGRRLVLNAWKDELEKNVSAKTEPQKSLVVQRNDLLCLPTPHRQKNMSSDINAPQKECPSLTIGKCSNKPEYDCRPIQKAYFG